MSLRACLRMPAVVLTGTMRVHVGVGRPGGDGLKPEDDGNSKGAGAGSVAHKADMLGQRAL